MEPLNFHLFYAIINENLLNQIDKQKFIEAKINEINNFD